MTTETDNAETDAPPPTADGKLLPPAARSFDAFARMLEDGKLNADLSDALVRINQVLSNHVIDFGGVPKARLAVSIGFTLKGGIFEIESGFKITLPDAPRGRTIAWSTERGEFTPNNPQQGQLVGVRDA